jgi:hypothetical protein
MRGALVTVLILLGFLAATVGVSVWAWRALDEVDIGVHGFAALVITAVGALVVGGGLIALMIYSNRRGYDDEAHRQEQHLLRRDKDEPD